MPGLPVWDKPLLIPVYLIIFFGVSSSLAFYLLSETYYTTLPAQVTGEEVTHGKGTHYVLYYQFTVNGQEFNDSDQVSDFIFDRFNNLSQMTAAERTLTVRFFQIGPFHNSSLTINASRRKGSLFVTFAWGICCIMFFLQWERWRRVRILYKYGSATNGMLIRRWSYKEERHYRHKVVITHYYLKILYADAKGKKIQIDSEVWNPRTWKLAQEGEVVTVLYNPRHPKRATVYEYAGYRVDDALSPRRLFTLSSPRKNTA
jgi:hypothetical protein